MTDPSRDGQGGRGGQGDRDRQDNRDDRDAQTGIPLDVQDRVRIVARSMAYYDDRLDRDRVASLSGRHPPAIETAVGKTVDWGRDPETYLERVFGGDFADELSSQSNAPSRQPNAPAVVVLPRNDRGDLAPYVLAQCLLAGRPYLVRPSSREAGEYAARTYHDSLLAAARDALDPDLAETVADECVLLDPEEFAASDVASVAPENVHLVLFGDDSTLASLEAAFAESGVEVASAIRMGSGRSSSVLSSDNSGELDAICREIVQSAAFDKGDDCTATSVLYVVGDREFYEAAFSAFAAAANDHVAGRDYASPADEQLAAAREQLRAIHPGETLTADSPTVVECTATAPVREFPVPVVQVKRAPNLARLREQMRADFSERESLVTSVFADDETVESLGELPTKLVKCSRPTHDIDLLGPHQGHYLVADLC